MLLWMGVSDVNQLPIVGDDALLGKRTAPNVAPRILERAACLRIGRLDLHVPLLATQFVEQVETLLTSHIGWGHEDRLRFLGLAGNGPLVKSLAQIGDNVRCGANTLITDSDWHLDDPRVGNSQPITLKDNVFLGVNSTVLKGVTIGENSMIGAGSLVVDNIPANVVATGNPCKVIKNIQEVC